MKSKVIGVARFKTPKQRKADYRAKLFGTLRMHINEFAEAKIMESWKGGGDPEDIPLIEAHLKRRRFLLNEHIKRMQEELL